MRYGVISALAVGGIVSISVEAKQPNILFCIADDWGTHAGVYGDTVVKTPFIDSLAAKGILFENAYISSPSCAPSRAAILTGQWHWRLKEAANLYGPIPADTPLYTGLLAQNGYFVGYTRKGWGPGRPPKGKGNPAGANFKDFSEFIKKRPDNKPFCFWFGSKDPHRSYKKGSGAAAGIPLDKIEVPACFPDSPEVRSDIADYYFEVQRFDRECGELVEMVREMGELDNTIVVISSDHGMPFPRCKSNVYDDGARVPMIIHWPGKYEGGHRIADFVSTTDLAPTFLKAAAIAIPPVMTGRPLQKHLTAGRGGRIETDWDSILFGKERHVPAQRDDDSGYPSRAIRTNDFLLIRNFKPERLPAGTDEWDKSKRKGLWFSDCDNGPTKSYMVANKDKDAEHRRLYDLAFAKRGEFELYDLKKDPAQQNNLVTNPEYAVVLSCLSKELEEKLRLSGDPRIVGDGGRFDTYPYSGGHPKYPKYKK